ncbi:MAG: HEAT repeat domain-containing protein [Planctomycetota bacterium]
MNGTHRMAPRAPRAGRSHLPLLAAAAALLIVALGAYQWLSSRPGSDDPRELTGTAALEGVSAGREKEEAPPSRPAAEEMEEGPARAPAPGEEEVRRRLMKLFEDTYFDLNIDAEGAVRIARAREELEEYLAGLPPEMVPLLLEILDENPDFVNRRFLIRALGEIGSDEASLGLVDYYRRLRDAEGNANEMKYTIEAIGRVDSDLSYSLLTAMIEEEAEKPNRLRFVEQLGEHSRRREAVPIFTELMMEEANFQVRNRAAQALKKTAERSSAPDIEKALETEENPYVRQTMLGALGAIGDAGSFGSLERIATSDEDPVTRMSAVAAIAKIGGADAKRILEGIAEEDTNARVRFDARRAIVKLEGRGF